MKRQKKTSIQINKSCSLEFSIKKNLKKFMFEFSIVKKYEIINFDPTLRLKIDDFKIKNFENKLNIFLFN